MPTETSTSSGSPGLNGERRVMTGTCFSAFQSADFIKLLIICSFLFGYLRHEWRGTGRETVAIVRGVTRERAREHYGCDG